MDLLTYLNDLPAGGKKKFAQDLGKPYPLIYQIARNIRRSSIPLAVEIEQLSNGAITCEELRDDVDWAFIRGTSKALVA